MHLSQGQRRLRWMNTSGKGMRLLKISSWLLKYLYCLHRKWGNTKAEIKAPEETFYSEDTLGTPWKLVCPYVWRDICLPTAENQVQTQWLPRTIRDPQNSAFPLRHQCQASVSEPRSTNRSSAKPAPKPSSALTLPWDPVPLTKHISNLYRTQVCMVRE